MKIKKHGITLIRLTELDLELLRKWRNNEEVRKYMNFQSYITPEKQKDWFKSINNQNNFYYIVEYNGDKIGLVNDKNIDWDKKTAEGGLFIWDKRYLNSTIPLKVSILMLELAYTLLGWNKTYIKVRKDNPRAVKYNEKLGYVKVDSEENLDFYTMELERNRFFENFNNIQRLISPDLKDQKIVLVFEEIDDLNGTREAVEKIFTLAPKDVDTNKIEIHYSNVT
jgi:UDP-4-amino-4,6-dideoxy-N-acetyl-beta-L-altrosamine N-acetyltransferase